MVLGPRTRYSRNGPEAAKPIAEAIEARAKADGVSVSAIGAKAGMSANWTSLIRRGRRPMSPRHIDALADALKLRGVDRERLIADALLTRAPDELRLLVDKLRDENARLRAEVERLRGRRRKRR